MNAITVNYPNLVTDKSRGFFPMSGNNYVRTEEDERNDRAEAEWKAARNNAAREEFMRRYPTGRVQ